MRSWFQSASDHGQVGYLAHPTQGYITIERIGDYWHVPGAGRRTLFAERAQAMAEQVAQGAAPRQYVIETLGRPMTVFAPDLVEPDVWVGAATRGRVVGIAGVRRIEDSAGAVLWQPLVEGVGAQGYAEPEQAMAFSLEAAHQRLDSNYGLHRRNGLHGASDRRHIRFQQAIKAHAPRGNSRITRAEIRATQVLHEVGFTCGEIARSMRWAPEVVADVIQRSLNDAHDRWVGHAGQPDKGVPRARRINATPARAPSVANEARATLWVRHPQGDVLFTARKGGASAYMSDAHRSRTHAVRIESRAQPGGERGWQVMLNGRRLGTPWPKLPDAMSFAVNTLHERAQVRAQVKPVAPAHNARARQRLEAAARQAPSLTPADRSVMAAGAPARERQRQASRQHPASAPNGIAAILAMPRLGAGNHRNAPTPDRHASGPDMGA